MSAGANVETYKYPAGADSPLQGWDIWEPGAESSEDKTRDAAPPRGNPANEADRVSQLEQRLAEETRRAFDAGRQKGELEGRQSERAAQAAEEAKTKGSRIREAAELVESFQKECDRYLREVEPEVVRLALAIAARILRREAQMDPLFLTGAVRVALGQIAENTEVRLHVPSGDLELWSEAMNLVPNLAQRPIVEAVEGMRLGDCEIKTAMGSADLGIRAQLAEIERGFFDRVGTRGAETPEARRPGGLRELGVDRQ
jgi:flagellar assembly protein FliH